MASGSAALQNSVVNLAAIKEAARSELLDLLDGIRGKKALVLDQTLSGPLGLVCEVQHLREAGIEKIYHLLPEPLEIETRNIIYLVRPSVPLMKMIANQIHLISETRQEKSFHVVFVPRRTMLCERVLTEEGVFGSVTIHEFHLDIIPMDEDVLSLEMDGCFKEYTVDGDPTSLVYVARALWKLQSMFGVIPHIKAKGNGAKAVVDLLLRLKREWQSSMDTSIIPEIDTLVVVDRQVDLITPMCTQFTYEGMLDECFGIHNTYLDVEPEILGLSSGKKVKLALNSNDRLFSQIRDLHVSVLGPLLHAKANSIQEIYAMKDKLTSITDINELVKKLKVVQPEHASLGNHINLCSKLSAILKEPGFGADINAEHAIMYMEDGAIEYIDDCLSRREPLYKVLRLLCLYSVINNGLKPKLFDLYRREILQNYGYEMMFTLQNLEKAGLLRRQEVKPVFPALRKNFRLIVEDVDLNNPADIAYVYSGYAPLSIRVVETAVKPGGLRANEELIRGIPGSAVEVEQHVESEDAVEPTPMPAQKTSVVAVCFVGGVTHAEIAALRHLSQKEEGRRDYLIITTKIINGRTMLKGLTDEIQNAIKEEALAAAGQTQSRS